ncbi:MAG: molybdopterin-synthase adenylyltransferase MoeB [Gammaproteobacteria bacterium]|nr:molybdopterin-synthase adenylyltransferase MoeB [Gammaproteobacteria bacterium]
MNDDQLLRYSRQIMLPSIGIEGQEHLSNARVVIIGMGGLGSPVAMYLAAAGVGTLILVDFDRVDLTNLQRQIIHTTERIGDLKVDSARETLSRINPECHIETIDQKLTPNEMQQQAEQADLVVDGSDNFTTRFMVNAACVATATPLVSGAAIRMEGQIGVFSGRPGEPCYHCLYDSNAQTDESCSENGVVAPLVGIIGSMQALEAIKIITGAGRPLLGRLLLFDALEMEWRSMRLKQDPACPVCGRENEA